MTTLEEMAREAGAEPVNDYGWNGEMAFGKAELERFAALVRAQALDEAAEAIHSHPHWIGPAAKQDIAAALIALKDRQ